MVWLKFTRFFLLPLFICRAVVQILCLDSNLDSRKKILDSIWIVLANDLDSCNFHKVATLLVPDVTRYAKVFEYPVNSGVNFDFSLVAIFD